MNKQTEEGLRVNRAEWIAIAAVVLNVSTLVFAGGAFWQTQQEHDRRILAMENAMQLRNAEMTTILVRLERIDSNTIALKERMDKGG